MQRTAELADACHADNSLAECCETDPLPVLREHGIDIPHGFDVGVVPNADETYHLVLPQGPNSVLEDESLGAVVGGSTASTASAFSSLTSDLLQLSDGYQRYRGPRIDDLLPS